MEENILKKTGIAVIKGEGISIIINTVGLVF